MDYHREARVDVRIARIFNTYGPRMCIDDGRVVSNFVAQVRRCYLPCIGVLYCTVLYCTVLMHVTKHVNIHVTILLLFVLHVTILLLFVLHVTTRAMLMSLLWSQAIRKEPMTVYGNGRDAKLPIRVRPW